jgi:hypothetical protein
MPTTTRSDTTARRTRMTRATTTSQQGQNNVTTLTILPHASDGMFSARVLVTVSGKGKQKWPATESNRLILSACTAVQREFGGSHAFRPRVMLVLGADKNGADMDTARQVRPRSFVKVPSCATATKVRTSLRSRLFIGPVHRTLSYRPSLLRRHQFLKRQEHYPFGGCRKENASSDIDNQPVVSPSSRPSYPFRTLSSTKRFRCGSEATLAKAV